MFCDLPQVTAPAVALSKVLASAIAWIQHEFRRVTSFCLRLSAVWLLFAATSVSAGVSDANRTSIMVVGAYHFVSKANLVSVPVDDPLSPARQAQIKALVDRLSAFHPTKVVLEQTSGSRYEAGGGGAAAALTLNVWFRANEC